MAIIRKQWSNDGTVKYVVGRSVLDEQQVMEIAREIALNNAPKGQGFTSPNRVKAFLQNICRGLEKEIFGVLFLNSQHQLIAAETIFEGTIDAAPVYPREIIKAIMKHNAAAVILYHNHPSGVAEPSQADERVTKRIQTALNTIDVKMLDHFVVGNEVVSFAERGLL